MPAVRPHRHRVRRAALGRWLGKKYFIRLGIVVSLRGSRNGRFPDISVSPEDGDPKSCGLARNPLDNDCGNRRPTLFD